MKNTLYAIAVCAAAGLGLLLGQRSPRQEELSSAMTRAPYQIEPTRPEYRSGKTGIAEQKVASGHNSSPLTPGVNIDTRTRQLFGIELATVQKTSSAGRLRLSGRVAVDESRIFRLNVGADGFVKETNDDGVGSHVRKDQRLAVIYSPEFLSIAGGYLSANERTQGINKESAPAYQGFAGPQTWADRLRNLGMSDSQIRELTSTRKVPEVVYINSPIDGFVIARNISAGETFDRYTEFYRIADLSHVWIVADLFPSEEQYLRPGMPARITFPGWAKPFDARIANVLPQVNTSTRALQLRLEADNKDFVLRPDMVVDAEVNVRASAGVSVPADAVLESGNSRRVFVEWSDGSLVPRNVETGERFGDRVEILEGLAPGERVVASGTFLVDSESRLRTAMTSEVLQAPGKSREPAEVKRVSADNVVKKFAE